MKELGLLELINNTLSNNSLLGDDCAYLKNLGIFITQDSLIEDIHFSLSTTNAYNLGIKSLMVNLSDIAASLSLPEYATISLSIPQYLDEVFIRDFYRGVNDTCSKIGLKIAGGDITGSDKLFISVCAIGKKACDHLSGRKYANPGDYIITTGTYGSSACGLYCLQNNIKSTEKIITKHIAPTARLKESEILRSNITKNIALMDTSDGLIDALYKIANSSGCKLEVSLEQIPFDKDIVQIAQQSNINYKNWIMWGGEDYELLACIEKETYLKLPKDKFTLIGKVCEKKTGGEVIIKDNDTETVVNREVFEEKSYNHFERK